LLQFGTECDKYHGDAVDPTEEKVEMVQQTAPEPDAPVRPHVPAPPAAVTDAAAEARPDQPAVEAELLVEDVSIDGMCGVY
jgi:mycofactocin precursor